MTSLDFKIAFKYPFNRAKGMWNILWILIPIIGWFALGGYTIRIVKEFVKGKFKQLPTFSFKSDLKLGFFMFLKAIPFILVYAVIIIPLRLLFPWLDLIVELFLGLFITPILFINFFVKETIESLFEFKIIKYVFKNIGDYFIAILKSLVLSLIFFLMWIILVGIPAGSFTKNIFLADFYRRNVK
ncbi:hypothetical protein CL616_01450 [archaeon]|nr:hypothetical protein [archaeon]|tara:strand:- start:222 stop:776 length:555 start_codon:yes stop_codon:yes gene_type:complete